MTQADLRKSGLALTDPPATLQPREIDLLIEFLFAKVIRKGPWTAPAASSSGEPKPRCAAA
jgi:hypothetical protein